MAFKAVNTLDSMVGHLDEKYRRFGWASARLDDVANFIPARLVRFLFPLASLVCGLQAVNCWRIAWREWTARAPAPMPASPRRRLPEPLGVQLGGMNYYHGTTLFRPHLGDPQRPLIRRHILDTIHLMYLVSFLTLGIGIALRMLVWHANSHRGNSQWRG